MKLVNSRQKFEEPEEPEEPEAPEIPEKPREKLDIRTHWFAPGGQPEFPKLVYSLNYGWKEVYDEEEFRELKITYTAPWGLPGLRWIEVPYTSTKPESRTKVAIPSAFVPLNDEKKDEKMVAVKKVHLRVFAAENDGEFVNIPKNTPEAENEKAEVVEEPKNEDVQDGEKGNAEGKEKQEFIFKNATTTLKMEEVTPKTLEDDKEQNPQKDEKESTSKATTFLGELMGSRTDTCPPITVRGEESEPLYWIVRAHPCNENPLELAKIFTTDDGKSFAYYGRPELVSLKKKKPL
ncbi:unnamed protein product, partial [Mesorhabditis belari]|uniref:Uncharacterized protein n=1 Tax=Mesorhabditis belari TaxID=2138241 RepID=A0AAF3F413_9BILA